MLINESEFTPGIPESVILSRVRAFVQDNSLDRQNGFALADGDRLFEKAALDSKHVAAIIAFVENEFGVIVSDCEMSEENLGSLNAVARFVASKQPFAVG
jgi:acyl carrier protein